MSENSMRPRRSFSAELKQDTIYLPGKQGNSFKDAADVVGVMAKSLSDWHEKLAPESERAMTTPRPFAAGWDQPSQETSATYGNGTLNLKKPRRISRRNHIEISREQATL